MKIEIKTDETLNPQKSIVIINGVEYNDIEGLQLKIAKNEKGELVIQHSSGYLEAYKAEVINDLWTITHLNFIQIH